MHKERLPECIEDLSRLNTLLESTSSNVETLHTDMHNLREDLFSKLDTKFSEYRSDCPLLSALEETQRNTILSILGKRDDDIDKKHKRINKLLNSVIAKRLIIFLLMAATFVIGMLSTSCEEGMHRIEDSYAVLESGKRRFVDRDLEAEPPVHGTVDRAEYNNAVQEEIAYCIEQYGGNCSITASADRTAGWHALHDTIFLGGNITDSAIDELSFDVITSGTIDITVSGHQWLQDNESLTIRHDVATSNYFRTVMSKTGLTALYQTAATTNKYMSLSYNTLNISEEDTGVDIAQTSVKARGIYYVQRFGNSTDLETANYRKEAYLLTGLSWSGSSRAYVATPSFDTGIPWTAGQPLPVVAAWLQYGNVSGAATSPVHIISTISSNQLRVTSIALNSPDPPLDPSAGLIIEYNAENL
jgi:hypothetical protein